MNLRQTFISTRKDFQRNTHEYALMFYVSLSFVLNFVQGIYKCIPKQTMLQISCSYNLRHMQRYFICWMLRTFTQVLSEVCVQCPIWLFLVVP